MDKLSIVLILWGLTILVLFLATVITSYYAREYKFSNELAERSMQNAANSLELADRSLELAKQYSTEVSDLQQRWLNFAKKVDKVDPELAEDFTMELEKAMKSE